MFIDTYKDKVVFAVYGDKNAGFYTYDPSTGAVSDGPVITTSGNPMFLHSFE